MSKKDFSTDTNDVFSNFFSAPASNTIPAEETKEKQVETKKVEPKKEVKKVKKVVEKKEITENIKIQEPVITTKTEVISISQEKAPKTHSKDSRYNFFVNNELSEYVSNITWIKRQKNVATYMNSLIKKDFIEFLNLPTGATEEELTIAWEQYKTENNL